MYQYITIIYQNNGKEIKNESRRISPISFHYEWTELRRSFFPVL